MTGINTTKSEIADRLYSAFTLTKRDNSTEFYSVDESKLSLSECKQLQSTIYEIHNNAPNDIEYNWIHTAIARLSDENLDAANYDLSELYCDFELIYTTEIIDAIAYLDIDISAPVADGYSIADVVQNNFLEYMQNACYLLYELICSLYDNAIV